MKTSSGLPETLGALRAYKNYGNTPSARVKDELRENLICKLERREPLFPGIVGYEDTVVPQIVNAVLSRHNFILLGLARAGQDAADPHAGDAARRAGALHRRLRDPRQSVRPDLPGVPRI